MDTPGDVRLALNLQLLTPAREHRACRGPRSQAPADSLRKTEINSFYQTETLPEPCEVCPGFQFSIDWPRGPKAWDSSQIAQDWEVVGL